MNTITWQPGVTLDEIEKKIILAALRHYSGNKTKTADALNIAIRTLDYKLDRYKNKGDKNEKKDDVDSQETETILPRGI